VSAAALTQDGHADMAYTLTGPETLTARQRVARLGAVLGRAPVLDELAVEQGPHAVA
jgi:uncharacterized protein YbjT (DUF2867 family)